MVAPQQGGLERVLLAQKLLASLVGYGREPTRDEPDGETTMLHRMHPQWGVVGEPRAGS